MTFSCHFLHARSCAGQCPDLHFGFFLFMPQYDNESMFVYSENFLLFFCKFLLTCKYMCLLFVMASEKHQRPMNQYSLCDVSFYVSVFGIWDGL